MAGAVDATAGTVVSTAGAKFGEKPFCIEKSDCIEAPSFRRVVVDGGEEDGMEPNTDVVDGGKEDGMEPDAYRSAIAKDACTSYGLSSGQGVGDAFCHPLTHKHSSTPLESGTFHINGSIPLRSGLSRRHNFALVQYPSNESTTGCLSNSRINIPVITTMTEPGFTSTSVKSTRLASQHASPIQASTTSGKDCALSCSGASGRNWFKPSCGPVQGSGQGCELSATQSRGELGTGCGPRSVVSTPLQLNRGSHTIAAASSHTIAAASSHTIAAASSHTIAAASNHTIAAASSHTIAAASSHTIAAASSHTVAAASSHTIAAASGDRRHSTGNSQSILLDHHDTVTAINCNSHATQAASLNAGGVVEGTSRLMMFLGKLDRGNPSETSARVNGTTLAETFPTQILSSTHHAFDRADKVLKDISMLKKRVHSVLTENSETSDHYVSPKREQVSRRLGRRLGHKDHICMIYRM